MINITEVDVGGDECEALVLQVLRSGRLAQGPMVERLEMGFADLIGVDHVVAVNNGTTALVAAIAAAELAPGDEVITSPFTFVATVNACLEAGAVVRFADIGSDFNIDPAKISPLINERTRAILPVHLYGQCADMDPISSLITKHDLALIEDAAQAHGATYGAKGAGTFGTGCFSLYATKNMTTGEGGFVSTNDTATADRLKVLRNQGMRARYQYEMVGHNWRMTELQAAIGIPQLSTLRSKIESRSANAEMLSEGLAEVPGVEPPRTMDGRGHVWHQYTIRVLPEAKLTRDELSAALTDVGVANGIYYPRVAFDYDCYAEHPGVIAGEVPNAFEAAAQALSLPVHPGLSHSDVQQIVGAVRSALT